MKRKDDLNIELAEIDALREEILTDTCNEEEQFWAFQQYFSDQINFPVDAHIIGEPVSITEINYNGNARRGLTAKVRKANGSEYEITAMEVVFSKSKARIAGGAYRSWLGLEVFPAEPTAAGNINRHKAAEDDIDLSQPVELIVLTVKERVARCMIFDSARIITFRSGSLQDTAPGWILTVNPRKQWRYGNHPYLSGEIIAIHLDVGKLAITSLNLINMGYWNPTDEYWGEPGEPLEEWAKQIVQRGPRQQFEMERILPEIDPRKSEADLIFEANNLSVEGDKSGARQLLMKALEADIRCLDAHVHLGDLEYDLCWQYAIRYYESGLRIGELSLEKDFDGLLPWGFIENRPFLRCMFGYGNCLWRSGQFEEASNIFERLFRLNPSDNQGVRFLIDDVRVCKPWKNL